MSLSARANPAATQPLLYDARVDIAAWLASEVHLLTRN